MVWPSNITNVHFCVVMMVFISGEFPTTLPFGFEIYGENSNNSVVLWLGFTDGERNLTYIIFSKYLGLCFHE